MSTPTEIQAANLGDVNSVLNGHANADGTLKAAAAQAALGGLIPPIGTRVVFLGDSITSSNGSESITRQNNWAISFPTWATFFSKGKIIRARNAGIPGNKAADMLARFDTDVTPYAPNVVVIMAGTNDWNDTSTTTLIAYSVAIKSLVAKCYAIRAVPVLCTVPPNNVSAARRVRTALGNDWLRGYAARTGIALWDAFNLLVDPATGDYLAAYGSASTDHTHPINPGYKAMGLDLWNYLASLGLFPGITSLLPQDNADTNNLVTNGLYLTTTGAGTTLMPTGWSVQSGAHPAGVTASLITGDTTIKGNWWSIVADGTAAATDNEFLTIAGIVPGHTYAHVGRFKATGMRGADSGNGSTFLIGAAFNSTLLNDLYDFRCPSASSYDVSEGVFYQEMVAPSDATTLLVRHQLLNAVSGAGTLQVAQRGVYDLTALGLDGSI